MKGLEQIQLTEEQKEWDAYDDELLTNLLNIPNSDNISDNISETNKLNDTELPNIQIADDDIMDELFGKPNKQEDNKQEDNKQEENKQEIDHKPQYVPQNGQKIRYGYTMNISNKNWLKEISFEDVNKFEVLS